MNVRSLNVISKRNCLIFLLVSYLIFSPISPYILLRAVAAETFVHDIAVFSVATNVTAAAPGDHVGIAVDVGNQGDYPETFDITAYYRNATASYTITDTTVDMYAKTNTTVNLVWDTTGVTTGTYTITANATIVPDETDTADNSLADGTVDVTNTKVLVDPVLSSTNPTLSFTIDVKVQDVVDLLSYGIRVSFDGTILKAVDAKEGPFLKAGGSTFFSKTIEFDNIYVGCSLVGAMSGVSGSGNLFNVTFTVQKPGNSDLTILPSPGSALVDSLINPIPFTSIGGEFYTTTPVARFTYTPNPMNYPGRPIVGETVTFNATASYDPDQLHKGQSGTGITNYRWNFGDGATGEGSIVDHVYAVAGSYGVSLNVTDDDGETNLTNRDMAGRSSVLIQFHDIAVINVTVTPMQVAGGGTFSINATVLNMGNVPENLNVTAYANMQPVLTKRFNYWTPPDTEPKYSLLAGDNQTTTITWVTTSVQPGNYTISVEAYLVQQVGGRWESILGVEQNMYDNGMFYGDVTVTGEELHDLAITDVSVDPTLIELGEWSRIKVTVKNEGNVDENYNATITVYFGASPTNSTSWANRTLSAGASTRLEYNWQRGGLQTKEGLYNITVTVQLVNKTTLEPPSYEDANPTNNIFSEEVEINLEPVAEFTYSPSQPLVDQPVIFNATASYAPGDPGGTIQEYTWDFGDGSGLTQTDPTATHTYRINGMFHVTLTVTDNSNFEHSTERTLNIAPFQNILITDVTFSPNIATSGDSISIDVTVQTRFFQESFNVTTYYNDNEIQTQTGITQPVGNYTKLTFTWGTTGVPGGNYTIKGVATTTTEVMTHIGGIITLERLPSTITVTASPLTFSLGTTTTISGSVSPTESAVGVIIWYRLSGEGTWNQLASVTTSADGAYSQTWTPETAGNYVLRSSWQGTSVIGSDESDVLVVIVQEAALDLFLYTTIGLAVALVIVAFYFLKIRKPPVPK